jgi:hypothetical protein
MILKNLIGIFKEFGSVFGAMSLITGIFIRKRGNTGAIISCDPLRFTALNCVVLQKG